MITFRNVSFQILKTFQQVEEKNLVRKVEGNYEDNKKI